MILSFVSCILISDYEEYNFVYKDWNFNMVYFDVKITNSDPVKVSLNMKNEYESYTIIIDQKSSIKLSSPNNAAETEESTPDILNKGEIKSFWIRGMPIFNGIEIAVGVVGENIPFLSLVDSRQTLVLARFPVIGFYQNSAVIFSNVRKTETVYQCVEDQSKFYWSTGIGTKIECQTNSSHLLVGQDHSRSLLRQSSFKLF